MHELSLETWVDFAHALGIGLFVGLEREHSSLARDEEVSKEDEEKPDVVLGVRTFTLLAVLGWVTSLLAQTSPWFSPVALFVISALILAQYVTARDQGRGLTTEIAALLTFVMGMLVTGSRSLAVVVALATTVLLISKDWTRAAARHARAVARGARAAPAGRSRERARGRASGLRSAQ